MRSLSRPRLKISGWGRRCCNTSKPPTVRSTTTCFQTFTGKEQCVNPHTNEIETGANQYQNRWQNSQGDVTCTDDQFYDPNTDFNLHLIQDFKLGPIRPCGPAN